MGRRLSDPYAAGEAPDVMNRQEAGRFLRMGESAVQLLVNEGAIPHSKVPYPGGGRRLLFSKADLLAWMARYYEGPSRDGFLVIAADPLPAHPVPHGGRDAIRPGPAAFRKGAAVLE